MQCDAHLSQDKVQCRMRLPVFCTSRELQQDGVVARNTPLIKRIKPNGLRLDSRLVCKANREQVLRMLLGKRFHSARCNMVRPTLIRIPPFVWIDFPTTEPNPTVPFSPTLSPSSPKRR